MMAAEQMAESSGNKEPSVSRKQEGNKKKQQSNKTTEQMSNPTRLSRDVGKINTHNLTVSTANEMVMSPSNNQEPTIPPHGNLANLHAKIKTANWVFEKQFGHEGPGELQDGTDIAMCPNGNIAVTDYAASQVKIYNSNGQYKQSLDTTQGNKPGGISRPSGIAVNAIGCYYVIDRRYVKVFDAQCQYQSQFPAISPNNKPSDQEPTDLCGIAIDGNGHILVGGCNKRYISKHEQDGRHIGSIKVNIRPYYLSVCPNGNIVVSAWSHDIGAQVIDPNGQMLHTLNRPPGVSRWWPTGVCCYEDVIFIANLYSFSSDSSHGIYCFSMTGEYLGCVTNEVKNPWGLAITEDGNRLMVVSEQDVKIFKPK